VRKLALITVLAWVLSIIISAGLPVGAMEGLFQTSPPSEQPDLIVSSLDGPSSAGLGEVICARSAILNQGNADAEGFAVKFYLSVDVTINAAEDILVGQRIVGGLAPGASDVADTYLTIPDSAAPGDYYLGAIADADDEVVESSEDNNVGYDHDPIAIVGQISGVVFDDHNGNGTRDAGEEGIAGVIISLRRYSSVITTTTTLADGSYVFTNLQASDYVVEETDPAGYVSTTPNVVPVSLPPNRVVDFGDRGAGTLQGVVFDDYNGDGIQDAGEPGLSGVEVVLRAAGAIVSHTTTLADGSYTFAGVYAGGYRVEETDPPGYSSTTPNAVSVSLSPGGAVVVDFGDQHLGTISGVAFQDVNGSGARDVGEDGIGGITVILSGGMTTTTSVDGSYSFSDVAVGTYTVTTDVPVGFVRTTLGVVQVTLTGRGSAVARFGFRGQGTVSGVAFDDTDGDGVREPGEVGIGGVTVTLQSLIGGLDRTVVTDEGGFYAFEDVSEGSYDVLAYSPAGFVATTPSSARVLITAGGSASVNFGFQGEGTISGVAFNDINGNGVRDTGEVGIGGIAISVDGLLAVTLGDGSYSFHDVSEGSYMVVADEPPGFVRTTPGLVPVSVATGGSAVARFGFRGQGTVSGVAFNDINGNGVKDVGESGIGGITVNIDGEMAVTSSDGVYSFSDVSEGSYMVVADEPPGFVRTTPGLVPVSVATGGSAVANFGFQDQGTVSGMVFHDANGNRHKELWEGGIGGGIVRLRTRMGMVKEVTDTTGDGSYSFDDVRPGSYVVEVETPDGFTPTGPVRVSILVAPGGGATANFGFMAQARVSGQCFQDLDGDGEQGAGEPGIQCNVILASDPVTVTSSTEGFFSFSPVDPGAHNVLAILPSGFAHHGPPERGLSVATGGSSSVGFSFQGQSTVSGRVFNDANGNGLWDAGEGSLGGVVITLETVMGSTWDATVTDSDGTYLFTEVPADNYVVVEGDAQGYRSTTSNTVAVVVPSQGGAIANFGDQPQGTLSGMVFYDVNGDGDRDTGELGIGGVTVTLKLDGNVLSTTWTVGSGVYLFAGLGMGTYTVEEEDPEGFTSTSSNVVSITVGAGEATANFGDQMVGSVSGVVFHDWNGNGMRDPMEVGVSHVSVTLIETDNTYTTTTVGDGSYFFSGVEPGSYTVVEADPEGFASTTANVLDIVVEADSSASANFGDIPVWTVSGVVYHDTATSHAVVQGWSWAATGMAGIGGVTMNLRDSAGKLVASTMTSGDGSYLFNDVEAGDYMVEEVDPQGFSSTTPNTIVVSLSEEHPSATANFGDQISGGYYSYLPYIAKHVCLEPPVSGFEFYLPLIVKGYGSL